MVGFNCWINFKISEDFKVSVKMNYFPNGVSRIIAEYASPEYRLRDEIDENDLEWPEILANPNAVDIILAPENKNTLDSEYIFYNSDNRVVDYFLPHVISGDIKYLSKNSNDRVVDLILQPENRNKINWAYFSQNPNDKAVDFLLRPENQMKINQTFLLMNPNNRIVNMLIENPPNPHIANTSFLKGNSNDRIVNQFLPSIIDGAERETSWKRIPWNIVSDNSNPRVVDFLLKPKNRYIIPWSVFSQNPSIFVPNDDFIGSEKIERLLNSIEW